MLDGQGLELERGNQQALERLLQQMQDTSEGFVREQAAKAAGTAAMDNDAIYAAILPLLQHDDHNVRRTALIAVKKRLHSERVVFAAQEALEGRVKEFDRERDGIAAVRVMFQDVNGRCRFAAVDAFAKLIGQFHFEAVESAHSVLEDDEEWVRRFAADLLGKALISCQRFYSNLSEMAIPNVKEGFNELIAAGVHCYEVGLTLRGGGDAYMRRIAVQGLCAVACSEDSIQYDAPAQDNDSEGGSNGFDVDKDKKVYYTAKDAIKAREDGRAGRAHWSPVCTDSDTCSGPGPLRRALSFPAGGTEAFFHLVDNRMSFWHTRPDSLLPNDVRRGHLQNSFAGGRRPRWAWKPYQRYGPHL